MHRVAATHWLDSVDNAFRVTVDQGGIAYFLPDKRPCWMSWETHPYAVIVMDQGSDGVCALRAAQYKFCLCLEGFCDTSHAVHNDVDRAIADVGLRPLMLLMVCSLNLPFGPQKEDIRYLQIKYHMKQCFTKNNASTQPLFQSLAGKVIESIAASGH